MGAKIRNRLKTYTEKFKTANYSGILNRGDTVQITEMEIYIKVKDKV